MKLRRRMFARFLGVEGDAVELPSGDVCDLTIPNAAWGVEIFSIYLPHNDEDTCALADPSGHCEKRRYLFAWRRPAEDATHIEAASGHKEEIQGGDVIVLVGPG